MTKKIKIILLIALVTIFVIGGIVATIQLKSKANIINNNVGNIATLENESSENFNTMMLDYVYFLLNNGTLSAENATDNTLVVTLLQLENEYGFNQYNKCLKEETYVTITFDNDGNSTKTDLTSICSK